jgi:hypothetical protein
MATNRFENFTKAMEKITEAQMLLQKGPCSYYVSEITGAYDYLMDRFAPFKEGDRVMLKERPDPMPGGWAGSAHFLVRGALATVRSVDCTPDGFVIAVIFDEESWIKTNWDKNGTQSTEVILMEPGRKHLYGFGETALVKV